MSPDQLLWLPEAPSRGRHTTGICLGILLSPYTDAMFWNVPEVLNLTAWGLAVNLSLPHLCLVVWDRPVIPNGALAPPTCTYFTEALHVIRRSTTQCGCSRLQPIGVSLTESVGSRLTTLLATLGRPLGKITLCSPTAQ
jgi:hypothetical protein